MNNSTPINQLPNQTSSSQNSFVNDQQRQMITQAQQAIGNSQMPQNTQLSPDIINEDDAVIQDMLNNLNSSSQQEQQMQMPTSVPVYSQEELLHRLAAANNMNINQLANGYGQQAYMPPQQSQPIHIGYQFTNMISNELKLLALVFAVVIAVQFIPFHKYIGKYLSIDKIPYHDIILRAIIASLLIVVGKKLVG